MDKKDINNLLYFSILIVMILSFASFAYIIFLLQGEGPVCLLDPLQFAQSKGLEFIRINMAKVT